jgi:hypothetical protein
VTNDFFGLQQFFFLFISLTLKQGGKLIGQWFGLDGFFLDLRTRDGLSSRCCLELGLRHALHLLGHPVGFLFILVTWLVDHEFCLQSLGTQLSLQGLIAPHRLPGAG